MTNCEGLNFELPELEGVIFGFFVVELFGVVLFRF
jgi:hypothetical protein